ncbi:MAG: hypothetical protein NTW59_04630, partial [Candidatus Diapherotrites archaeon]|nr:hypothetical protein [Candidatus Diapherotrites archaeon]
MFSLVYSPRFLEHETGSHPERKERLIAITDFLRKKGFNTFEKPLEIGEKGLLLVHSEGLIKQVKALSGQKLVLGDNIFNANTFKIALLACGAAQTAAELACAGKGFSFALLRPPGHHAGRDFFGGFCYFNN